MHKMQCGDRIQAVWRAWSDRAAEQVQDGESGAGHHSLTAVCERSSGCARVVADIKGKKRARAMQRSKKIADRPPAARAGAFGSLCLFPWTECGCRLWGFRPSHAPPKISRVPAGGLEFSAPLLGGRQDGVHFSSTFLCFCFFFLLLVIFPSLRYAVGRT